MPVEDRERDVQYAQEPGIPRRAQLRPRPEASFLQLLPSEPPRLLHAPDLRAYLRCLPGAAAEVREQEESLGPSQSGSLSHCLPRHRRLFRLDASSASGSTERGIIYSFLPTHRGRRETCALLAVLEKTTGQKPTIKDPRKGASTGRRGNSLRIQGLGG